MNIQIRKQSATYWKHLIINGAQTNTIVDPNILAYIANNSLTIDWGGKNGSLENFPIDNISVYDDVNGGAEETYTTFDLLMNRLTELNYHGLTNSEGSTSVSSGVALKQGNILGASGDNKFGRNDDLDIADLPETVWIQGGLWRPPVSGAQQWNIVSTDANDTLLGTGARTVICTGIDDNDNLAVEVIEMDGTNNVLTNTLFRIIFRIRTGSVGTVFGRNIGDITGSPATDGGIGAKMTANSGSTEMAILAVPANTECFITSYYGNLRRNAASAVQVDMELQSLTDWDDDTSPLDTIHKMSYTITGSNPNQHILDPPIKVDEKSYIMCVVVGLSDDNTAFGAGFNYEFYPKS